jgi:hypothetical protein
MADSQPLGAAEVIGMGMGEPDRPHITRRLPDPLQRGEHSRQVAREPGVDHARSCRMGPGARRQARPPSEAKSRQQARHTSAAADIITPTRLPPFNPFAPRQRPTREGPAHRATQGR